MIPPGILAFAVCFLLVAVDCEPALAERHADMSCAREGAALSVSGEETVQLHGEAVPAAQRTNSVVCCKS
jgi:hypothetical protein